MARSVSPPRWMVTLNGVPLFRGFLSEEAARRKAEIWQGSHTEHRGLLKHKDRGDWVEVKRDYAAEREYDERVDAAQRGNRQIYTIQHEG
jgi:hypothetical protein